MKLDTTAAILVGLVVAFTAILPVAGNGATADVPTPADGLDVHRFGVKCDGSSDDTAAFRAVATAAGRGPALVRVPTGECMLDGAVTWSGSGIEIRGSGRGTMIVQRNPSSDTFVFAPADPATQSSYKNGISDISLARNGDATAGVGLRLVRQINFKGDNLDLREFFVALQIEGGSDLQFDNTTIAAGHLWPRTAVKAGSGFVRVVPAMAGAMRDTPGELFFSNFNWRGEQDVQQVDKGIVVQGVDGLWLANGHVGFDVADLVITPSVPGVNIQSVMVSNVAFDGSHFGGTGLAIPGNSVTGNIIQEIMFSNSIFANHVTQGVLIEDKSVLGLKFVGGTFRNERGWCLNAAAVGRIEVYGNTFTGCGGKVAGTGALSIGATVAARRAIVSGNLFDNCAASAGLNAQSLTNVGNSFEASCTK